jgi:hypothetical protein
MVNEARVRRHMRIAPERTTVLARQSRILHANSIIEVPGNMWRRNADE